jgi:hypothetical protein
MSEKTVTVTATHKTFWGHFIRPAGDTNTTRWGQLIRLAGDIHATRWGHSYDLLGTIVGGSPRHHGLSPSTTIYNLSTTNNNSGCCLFAEENV